jgi:hypothetical protein
MKAIGEGFAGGMSVAKDKKKNKKDKKSSGSGAATKTGKGLRSIAQNPLVADVVAAALVATASALKDSKKARQLASEASDELSKLSKAGAEKGNALWEMALQIGRRSLETLSSEDSPKRSKSQVGSKKGSPKSKPSKRRGD